MLCLLLALPHTHTRLLFCSNWWNVPERVLRTTASTIKKGQSGIVGNLAEVANAALRRNADNCTALEAAQADFRAALAISAAYRNLANNVSSKHLSRVNTTNSTLLFREAGNAARVQTQAIDAELKVCQHSVVLFLVHIKRPLAHVTLTLTHAGYR
jgi:hypothetical protein